MSGDSERKPGLVLEQTTDDVVAIQAWDKDGNPVMIRVVLVENRTELRSRVRYLAPKTLPIVLTEGGAKQAMEDHHRG